MGKKKIETRKSEIRYRTSDPKKMLDMYFTENIFRKWTEDFMDEDSGEVVSIERSERLFFAGEKITQDNLAKIRFYMAEGAFKDVAVTSQNRKAKEENWCRAFPYIAQIIINEKKRKVLLYAESVDNALEILRDFVELNLNGPFRIVMVKEFEPCVILTDDLKGVKYSFEKDFCAGKISVDEFCNALAKQVLDEEKETEPEEEKKWYKISAKITTIDDLGEELASECYTFVVHAVSAERANVLINIYMARKKSERDKKDLEDGNEPKKETAIAAIEESNIIPISIFVPKAFSEVYASK